MCQLIWRDTRVVLSRLHHHLQSDRRCASCLRGGGKRKFFQVNTVPTCTRFGSCRRPHSPLQDVPSHLTCHLQTIAPGPFRSSTSHQDRCRAERPILQLTNCPKKPKRLCRKVRSHPNTLLPLPSSTTHRLILLRQVRHRLCEGRSVGIRARTAWETEVANRKSVSSGPLARFIVWTARW